MICAGEFIMADEAFALSPISARASQPREEDYEAISDAFMETSRGRWFLTEYAKRNRNADTRMVLDAVARIEESLVAQQQPPPQRELAEAMAAIRTAVDDARASASAAIDDTSLEQTLVPVRKGARVIREIAWRLREIGADGRICDLIDSQVSVIEAGCGQIATVNPAIALSAAFDLIQERIADFDDNAAASPQAEAAPMPSPAPSDEIPVADADAADDEAVLDMIALEMAAPDPSDSSDIGETHLAEPSLAIPEEAITQMPEPVAAPAPPPMVQPLPELSYRPSHQPSLGATLIANGIVRKSNAPASDPLAPIRRMSQAEKIAFFS
jgi:hypothetical protein